MQNKIINRKFLELLIINQKNIMIMLVSIIATFFVFWFFVYSPKRKQTKEIKSEYEAMKKDIKEIESMAGGGMLDASLPLLDKKLKVLEKKLPPSEETTLKEIASFANRSGIDVISLTPHAIKKSPMQGDIPGYECMELSIMMDLRCTYKTLGEYLRLLQEEFPTVVRIKNISMSKEKSADKTDSALRARLVLIMYMLHEKK